jgi:hypothetical protein
MNAFFCSFNRIGSPEIGERIKYKNNMGARHCAYTPASSHFSPKYNLNMNGPKSSRMIVNGMAKITEVRTVFLMIGYNDSPLFIAFPASI